MLVSLLSRIFIKDRENIKDTNVREAYGILCGILGLFLNLVISAAKFITGFISGSVALTADAVNNLTDAIGAGTTLAGFKLSNKKADRGHPFGHGRIEYLAGLAVSFFTLLAGAELLRASVTAIMSPGGNRTEKAALAVIAISIAVKCYMAAYNAAIAKKISSPALNAAAKDSLADAVSTSLVLLSFLFSHFFPSSAFPFDGVAGILIAIFILYNGVSSAKETINPLLGIPANAEFAKNIEQIVLSHEPVSGMHDLVIHDYGPGRVMISLHAEVPGKSNIFDMHKIIDDIENDIMIQTGCAATIHMDPVDLDNDEFIKTKEILKNVLTSLNPELKFHDLHIVPDKTNTNLIFDVIRPGNIKNTEIEDSALRREINTLIKKELGDNYRCLIRIESAFV